MSHATLNQLVESRLASQWGATTPIRYENVEFTQPSSGSWISVAVKESDSRKITLGSGAQVERTIGTIFVEIFTPVGGGSGVARGYADTIKTIFRDYRVQGLHVYRGEFVPVGEKYYTNSGTGVPATSQQYQAFVGFPFRYDVTI